MDGLPNPDFSSLATEELAPTLKLWEHAVRTHAARLTDLESTAADARELREPLHESVITGLSRSKTLHTHAVRQTTRLREVMRARKVAA